MARTANMSEYRAWIFLVLFSLPVLSLAEEGVVYLDDQRQEKFTDISRYMNVQFKRARRAQEEKRYLDSWETYVAIQKEIPEGFILKEGIDQESARLMAWKEMKALLERAGRNANALFALQLLDISLEKALQREWDKITEDIEFSHHEGFQLSCLLAPHLPTETAGRWVEKMGDTYVEQGNFLRAYACYKAIKDHSMAYGKTRIDEKLENIKKVLDERLSKIEKASAVQGLKLTDGTIFRLVIEERGAHQEKIPYLEIRFDEGMGPKAIRKRIYDFELPYLNSKKYGPLLIRDEDKILLMPQFGNMFLVFDFNGMLLEKKSITRDIASRYKEVKSFYRLLFLEEDFALIPKGTFSMGSPPPPDQEWRDDDETLHAVTLTKGFYLQRKEVTQLQWHIVMGEISSRFKERKYCEEEWDEELKICPHHAVEQVSWEDAQEFIRKLNRIQKEYLYRLPTEAEWEYAARVSGISEEERRKFVTVDHLLDIRESHMAKAMYGFGNDENELGQYAWYCANASDQTHSVLDPRVKPVGGLHNMHGNVWEWVSDRYNAHYGLTTDQLEKIVEDPQGPSEGFYRVIRGGGWGVKAQFLRSAYRGVVSPDSRRYSVGFRVVRIPQID